MISFGTPWMMMLFLAVILRLILRIVDLRRRHGFSYSSLVLLEQKRGWRVRTRWVPFVFEIGGLCLLVVALARPQEIIRLPSDRMGIDLAIVLDASGSMAAEDFRPRNRFTVARQLIDDFIARRIDDRIGLITFGSRAATRVPVTFDRAVARETLKNVQIGENGDGTAIGHAIATGVNRLRPSKTESRVLILVTDGVNNAGSIDPATAASLAAHYGIRIYAIGVGSRGPVPVPVRVQNRFTGELETVYHLIRADLDEGMLTAVAEQTGGRYFRATDEETLQGILETIDDLEKSRLEAPPAQTVRELYATPLSAGLMLLGIALLTGETLWMRLPA
ncbi:MAG TPA: VWA domain-containing protein [Thermoanaerobaculia bacterium]|nr:VWA domain-containing protein [Thermoanaerobaculia bacterium]